MPSADSLRLTIKWVLLPNGISADGQELLFSAYAALALAGDDVGGPPTLADYPDLLDWPATVAGMDFGVEFDGSGQRVPARLLPGERSTAVWQAVFGPTMTAVPFQPEDLTHRPVMTFSAVTVLESLRHSYGRLVVDSIDDLSLIAPFAPTLVAEDRPFADIAAALQQPMLRSLMGGGESRAGMLRTLVAGATTRADSPTGMIEVLPQGEGPADEVVRAVAFHTAQEPPPAAPHARAAGRGPAGAARLGGLPQDHLQPERASGAAPPAGSGDRTGRAPFGDKSDLGDRTAAAAVDQHVSRRRSTKADRPLWIAWRLDPAAALPFAAAAHPLPGVLDIGSADTVLGASDGAGQRGAADRGHGVRPAAGR